MTKKSFLLAAAAFVATSLFAQNYKIGDPNKPEHAYLNDYAPLKAYINRVKYPNFKLGIGTTVNEYLQKGTVYKCTNENFNETVAGNAMKMASCVSSNGSMNFSNVTNYVNTATAAGLVVYGHTLAWHSQQPNAWLRSLIKDKPAAELTDGDVEILSVVASKDFRTQQNVGWTASMSDNGYSLSYSATDGLKATTTMSKPWEVQFVIMDNISLASGKKYKMTMTVKGSKDGKFDGKLGDWGGGANFTVNYTTEWKEVTVDITPTMASNFILLHIPNYIGDSYIKNVKFEEIKKGKTINEPDRRCLKVEAGARVSDVWDNQLWFQPGSFASGASYVFTADVRADKPATASTQIHNAPGSYVSSNGIGTVNFTTEWKTVTFSGKFSAAGQSIALNLSELAEANNYYFDNVSFKVNGVEKMKNGDFEGTEVSTVKVKVAGGGVVTPAITEGISFVYVPGTVALTKAEKCVILQGAMEKWIKGMMEACNGKVKAWDVVNEAISGGGNDGSGNYTLQHSDGFNGDATWDVGGDAFYWQDHMGDLEYVRSAVKYARQYGPADVKLFINDYNLESDWDNNKKLSSLINWIKKWEADGVTKIDGIGTQMHISYYENSGTQNSKKSAITRMFQMMANSGKLVRVSEMDMGYVNSSGKTLGTLELTEAQHKNMADFYEWIIKEYLRLIPAAQQWGICQWCPTDGAGAIGTGWRGGEPVGIWTLNTYYRKHAYAGFVRGLGGQLSEEYENMYKREPYKTVTLPGVIEAEDFDKGSEGVVFHDNDAEDKGNCGYRTDNKGVDIFKIDDRHVVGTEKDEWLEYTVDVKEAGSYVCKATVANNAGTTLSFAVNKVVGEEISSLCSFRITSANSPVGTFVEKTTTTPQYLKEGKLVVRITINSGDFYLDKIEFINTSSTGIQSAAQLSDCLYTVYSLSGSKLGTVKAHGSSDLKQQIANKAGKTGVFIIRNEATGKAEKVSVK